MPETGDAQPQAQKPAAAALQAKLNQGMALHRQGKLADAERCYGEVLQRQPDHFDALHLLGVIACQTRRTERGVELIKRAIGLNPKVAAAHSNLGNALMDLKRPAEALASYDRAIALKSDYAAAHNNRGNALKDLNRPAEALASYDRTIALKPDYAEAHTNRGNALMDLKRPEEALASYDKAIALKPDYAEAHNNRGNALRDLKRSEEALASYDKVIALKPDVAEGHYNRGTALKDLKRPAEALASYDNAIALKPDFAAAHSNRGTALTDLKRPEEALASYDKAIALKPDYAEAHSNRGTALTDLKRPEEALASCDKAIALKPDYAEAHTNRGNALMDLKRPAEALASCDRAIALKPDVVEAHNIRGNALMDLKRPAEALASYDRAIALKPDYAEAHSNRGNVLCDLKRYDETFAAYDKALTLKPNLAGAWLGRGNVFNKLKRYEEAASAYANLLAIEPQYPFVKGMFLHQRMLSCDWRGIEDLIAEIDGDVASGKRSAEPFGYQAIVHSERDFKLCAEIFAADKFPRSPTPLWRGERYDNTKIRVGYLSSEFRDHVVSRLTTELFELHDKNRFELFAFDNGWDDGSALRGRINKAFNTIVDISRLDDLQVASAIKQRQIDILVNLNGYSGEHRTRVFSYKPSPIQVSYLGFNATMGTDYIDYIIADRYIIPPEYKTFYTESVVYLPDTYQVNDTKRQIAMRTPARAELKLPDTGFVFCCFNNSFKITSEIFDVWMRLLNKVDDSVLWLSERNLAVSRNLREAAKYRNIAPERLVFLLPKEYSDYLATISGCRLVFGYVTIQCWWNSE